VQYKRFPSICGSYSIDTKFTRIYALFGVWVAVFGRNFQELSEKSRTKKLPVLQKCDLLAYCSPGHFHPGVTVEGLNGRNG